MSCSGTSEVSLVLMLSLLMKWVTILDLAMTQVKLDNTKPVSFVIIIVIIVIIVVIVIIVTIVIIVVIAIIVNIIIIIIIKLCY